MKTLQERVLTLASTKGTLNTATLKRAFKSYAAEPGYLHNSVARVMRQASTDGYLKRTGRGEYTLSKKGVKYMATA